MLNDTLTDRLNRALAKLKDAEADERIVVLLSKEEIKLLLRHARASSLLGIKSSNDKTVEMKWT